MVKNPAANAGHTRDLRSIPGSGRSPGGGRGNPLQYYCLGNPLDRGAWQAPAHGVTKSQTRLNDWHTQPIQKALPNTHSTIFFLFLPVIQNVLLLTTINSIYTVLYHMKSVSINYLK